MRRCTTLLEHRKERIAGRRKDLGRRSDFTKSRAVKEEPSSIGEKLGERERQRGRRDEGNKEESSSVGKRKVKVDVERRYETSLMVLNTLDNVQKPIEKVGQCTLIRTCCFSISAPTTHDLGAVLPGENKVRTISTFRCSRKTFEKSLCSERTLNHVTALSMIYFSRTKNPNKRHFGKNKA
ncbi:hypothetical protein YC2023_028919 [Brassica napus]